MINKKEEAMTYIPNPDRISIIGGWEGLTAKGPEWT